ncbi:MAG: WecB/TagA/CpsF family glycosyltransferase [Candidatus Magasanikbacteria bacterium]
MVDPGDLGGLCSKFYKTQITRISMMNQDFIKILDVRIDILDKSKALQKVAEFLESNKQYKIFTPNPEMLVDAQKDREFKDILNSSDLNICDGRGIQLVSREKIERIPGVDFMLDICKLAEQKKYSVYFLGSDSSEVISNLKLVIQNKFPNLKIAGLHRGHKLLVANYQLKYDKEKNDELIAEITMAQPDILFIAFGHVKQERWIHENLKDLPSVKIAMGVGGAFDYTAGMKKRAPAWMRKIGLEWLFRLLYEPKRIGRIIKATLFFLFLNVFKKAP